MDFSPTDSVRYRLSKGDVLVCEGGEVGRAAVWDGRLEECYYQKALHRVRTSSALSPVFLRYLLEHYARTKAFERFTSGSTIAHLPQEDLRNLPIPVPPRAEQHRIVAAIEEQFSRLDAGVATLDRVRQNLNRMRASVLRRAVSGQLVPDSSARGSEEHDLPEGWRWEPLEAIITRLKNGVFVSRPVVEPVGPPILRISAVRPLSLDISDVRHVPHPNRLDRAADYVLEEGDLLFTRYSGNPEYVGACAMVPAGAQPLLYPDKLIRVQVDRSVVTPRFVEIAASAGQTRAEIRRRVKTTAGQTGISGGDLKGVPFPIPPLNTQRAIIDEVDRHFSRISALDAEIDQVRARAARLCSAILTAAFSGKLVPQDPTDEPASILLERIAAERAAAFNGREPARTPRQERLPL
jgi:type I restriction enzyme S subunit